MDTETCLKPLLERRSIRHYEEREVPMELLLKILDIARWAPSSRNLQPWEFVVIRNRDTLNKLSKIHAGAAPLSRAPAAIAVLCDSEKAPLTHHVDCANAAMYIMLAAHCLGLGTVWINSLRNIDMVREILRAPRDMVPIALIAIGYPAEKPSAKERKPLEDIVHVEKYGAALRR